MVFRDPLGAAHARIAMLEGELAAARREIIELRGQLVLGDGQVAELRVGKEMAEVSLAAERENAQAHAHVLKLLQQKMDELTTELARARVDRAQTTVSRREALSRSRASTVSGLG